MVQLKLFLLVVIAHEASCMLIGRVGFIIQSKQWNEVVGKSEEEAKELIRRDLPNIEFVVVSDDTYQFIPSEGYLNQVLLGVSSTGEVRHPAKYFGYVPDLSFANNYVGKPYAEAVEKLKSLVPSCKVVVFRDGQVVHSCCNQDFLDYIRLEVDSNGLLLHLPEFVPKIYE